MQAGCKKPLQVAALFRETGPIGIEIDTAAEQSSTAEQHRKMTQCGEKENKDSEDYRTTIAFTVKRWLRRVMRPEVESDGRTLRASTDRG